MPNCPNFPQWRGDAQCWVQALHSDPECVRCFCSTYRESIIGFACKLTSKHEFIQVIETAFCDGRMDAMAAFNFRKKVVAIVTNKEE